MHFTEQFILRLQIVLCVEIQMAKIRYANLYKYNRYNSFRKHAKCMQRIFAALFLRMEHLKSQNKRISVVHPVKHTLNVLKCVWNIRFIGLCEYAAPQASTRVTSFLKYQWTQFQTSSKKPKKTKQKKKLNQSTQIQI